MSETPTAPVETATGVHTSEAAEHVTEKADEHTPETPVPPKETHTDATTAKGTDDLSAIVESLATSVKVLTDEVMHLKEPDAPTAKVPFLLRGKKEL
jgi:hypothetical protein